VSILRTVDLDSHEASERPHYRATLYAGLVWTPSAVYFQKCNTASSQTKRRLAVTPVRASSPADKDRLTDDKNTEDHVPCYQANLKSTVSKLQALKGVEVKTNDVLCSSAYWTWVAPHFRGLGEPFSRSGHGGHLAGNEREPHSHTYRQSYPSFTSSTCILAALSNLPKSRPPTA
jgi:hypothetical protein